MEKSGGERHSTRWKGCGWQPEYRMTTWAKEKGVGRGDVSFHHKERGGAAFSMKG